MNQIIYQKQTEEREAMGARAKIGGIYIDKGVPMEEVEEFALCIGRENTLWFGVNEEIETIHGLQEIGSISNLELVDGYSFGIDKSKKIWRVRDTGHKNCKHILWYGKYSNERVETEIQKLKKALLI